MFEVRDFNKDNWKCSLALARMLFEEGKLDNLASKIREFLNQPEGGADKMFPCSSGGAIKSLVQIREQVPALNLDQKAHPVLWVRFAFWLQSRGIGLADRFLLCYAKWREECSDEFGGSHVYWAARKDGGKGVTKSCPLDYFLHTPNIGIDFRTRGVILSLKHSTGMLKEQIEAPKRTDADLVGSHSLKEIKMGVNDAVANRSINGLTGNTEDGRYICYLTRKALAEALKKKYWKAQRPSVNSIERVIGKFVACSRPRPIGS